CYFVPRTVCCEIRTRSRYPQQTSRRVKAGEAAVSSLYIDGSWLPASASGRREVINPFDRSIVATVDEADATDVAAAVAAARTAFDRGDWPGAPAAERGALLDRVAELLLRDKDT